MKKYILALLISGFGLSTGYFLFSGQKPLESTLNPTISAKLEAHSAGKIKDQTDRPDEAIAFEVEKTKDPKLGYVPTERRIQAFLQTKDSRTKRQIQTDAIDGVKWVERGPTNVGGRTRALVFDPNDSENKKVWAGSVGGGLWYNNDITQATSQWQNVDDFWVNIAVTSIAFDPSDDDVMYIGTGEGWFNSDAIRGAGIWKSTDGGSTFSQLSSTDNSTFYYVQKIVVASNGDVFAATRNGSVQRSEDGGASWSRVLNSGNVRAADLEIAANGDIYASLGIFSSPSVYRTVDNGDNWTDVSPSTISSGRIELAVAPSASSSTASTVIYAVKYDGDASGSDDVSWVKRSADGGSNWSDLTIPTDLASGNEFTRGQAWYDLILCVHPSDEDIVIMGGIDLHRTSDGGTTWTGVSQWYGGNDKPYVHADQHAIVFRPGNDDEAIFGNDGGVYYSQDVGSSSTPNFSGQNYGYNVTQFYALSMENSAGSNYFIAGAQDNGSQQFNFVGLNPTIEVTGGDGAFTFIDQDDPDIQITGYTNNNYYISTDGGENFDDLGSPSSDGRFINPADYDDDTNILYAAGEANEMIRYSGIGATVTTTTVSLSISNHQISAVTVSPYTDDRVFIGTGSGAIYILDDADATPSLTNISGSVDDESGYVSSIAIGATDNELIATLSSYGVTSVFYSTNGGTSWTSKDESSYGLPDMPIRWALFNPNNTNEVLLATETGVWSTDDITQTNPVWESSNTELANVRCDMLQIRSADNLVGIATHGRGLFTSDIFANATAQFTAEHEEWYVGVPLSFEDGSLQATAWEWDFENDGIVDATVQNPDHTYFSTGLKTVKLVINNDEGITITKTDYINIIERPSVPFSTGFESDGAGFFAYLINAASYEIWEWGAGTSDKNNLNPGNGASTITGSANWMTSLTSHHGYSTKYALETPPFSFLNGTGTYTLSFKYRAVTGSGAGMNLEYSTDGGDNWQILGSNGDGNGTNWYNTTAIIGLSGADGWAGASFSKITASYDISSFIDEDDVRFRFVFGSRNSANDGFQIDDFSISGNATSLPFTWNGSVSSAWENADNWSSGSVPTSSDNVIITTTSNDPIVVDDRAVDNLEIESGATLTVESGGALAIYGLVSNDGTYTVKRNITESGGYSIIGSPVVGTTTDQLNAKHVYSFDGSSYSSNLKNSVVDMNPGQGFFVGYSTASPSVSFTGTPNSGTITSEVTDGDFELVANPYSAAISISDFLSENSSIINGTVYFWDDGGSNVDDKRGGDFVTTNGLGSTGITQPDGTDDGVGGLLGTTGAANGYITSVQGVYVEAIQTGDVTFTQEMQVTTTDANNDDNHYRNNNVQYQKIKLAVSGNDLYNEVLIGLGEDASFGHDHHLDAKKIESDYPLAFYSLIDNIKYTIQGLPLVRDDNPVNTLLGVKAGEPGIYEISIAGLLEFPEGYSISLTNLATGKKSDLREESVFFETFEPNAEGRFELILSPKAVLANAKPLIGLKVYGTTSLLNIEYFGSESNKVSITTLSGQLIYNDEVTFENGTAHLDIGLKSNQVYLLRVENVAAKFVLK
ncbi:MAG: PKD domain-containing protein [Marinoscillum sp.]